MSKSSPDLTEFFKLSKPKRPPCQIGLILSGQVSPKLKPEEAEQLTAACAADKGVITGGAIAEWLKQRDHEVSVNRISNHRRGVCTCA